MNLTLLLPFLLGVIDFNQNPGDVTKIEFSSVTRGHQEIIFFTRDSVKYQVNGRIAERKMLQKKDWDAFGQSMKSLSIADVANLKSPTMKRAYDGHVIQLLLSSQTRKPFRMLSMTRNLTRNLCH